MGHCPHAAAMAGFTTLSDTCVLYPATLLNMLVRLAMTYLFRARWSAAIHDEWTEVALKTRPELHVLGTLWTRTCSLAWS